MKRSISISRRTTNPALLLYLLGGSATVAWAQVPYEVQGRKGVLTLQQVAVTLPKNYEESLGLRRYNPPTESYPDTALTVIDSTISPAKETRVVGVAYFNMFYTDRDSLVSKLIWDEQKRAAYLVTANAGNTVVRLRVFRVVPSQLVALHPPQFSADDYRKWPPQLPLLGELEVDVLSKGKCLVKDLGVTLQASDLRIATQWDDKRCATREFHYYLSNNQWSGDPIAQTSYQSGSQAGKLELFKVRVDRPKAFDFAAYHKKHSQPFPNYAYFLVGDAGASSPSKVLWLDYEAATSMYPRDRLAGSIVWDEQRKAAFIVTVKTNSTGSILKIYRVSLDSTAAAFPFLLDTDPSKWPEGGASIGQTEIQATCVASVKGSIKGDSLLIETEAGGRSCETSKLAFDLNNLKWSGH